MCAVRLAQPKIMPLEPQCLAVRYPLSHFQVVVQWFGLSPTDNATSAPEICRGVHLCDVICSLHGAVVEDANSSCLALDISYQTNVADSFNKKWVESVPIHLARAPLLRCFAVCHVLFPFGIWYEGNGHIDLPFWTRRFLGRFHMAPWQRTCVTNLPPWLVLVVKAHSC